MVYNQHTADDGLGSHIKANGRIMGLNFLAFKKGFEVKPKIQRDVKTIKYEWDSKIGKRQEKSMMSSL